MDYLLGYDIGSSSVKAALLDAASGKPVASAFSPASEMEIVSPTSGFAEQNPLNWWAELVNATDLLKNRHPFQPNNIIAIGISYQMHGLVCVDEHLQPLRSSIIWCDSRAVDIGNKAFNELGHEFCLHHFLNSPGNFTASKLKWVKENEPGLFKKIHRFLLPGDFIALQLTGEASTTVSGLSEGILWNFISGAPAKELMDYYQIDESLLAPLVPTFGEQGKLTAKAAATLGLRTGIPVTYRAGDQPNNAFSLNALEPGEIAATAGTSGVIYGVTDKITYDPLSRVNSFVHVNHSPEKPRYGVLLCVNGTGILNSWMRKNLFSSLSYDEMNRIASAAPVGSENLHFYPFGNGAERMLNNKETGAWLSNLDFNHHQPAHIVRSAQEGIVFALNYGAEIMREMGIKLSGIRAGYANMFLSDVFAETFANVTGCTIELYNTDGALGAARGAGIGAGIFRDFKTCFSGMEVIKIVKPSPSQSEQTLQAYASWKKELISNI